MRIGPDPDSVWGSVEMSALGRSDSLRECQVNRVSEGSMELVELDRFGNAKVERRSLRCPGSDWSGPAVERSDRRCR
ncbi:MAG: hypothetical protein CME26_11370 [Gemmatimonadetes bacterium]|nr:hypothetical protein [Gemmatimonadota bacterium]